MDKMTLYPWLVPIYQQLTHTFLQGRGHHALLFKTEVGLGTEQLISQFADWLLCQMPQGEKPCHQCKSCLLRQSGNHPDFHLLAPQESKESARTQPTATNICAARWQYCGVHSRGR